MHNQRGANQRPDEHGQNAHQGPALEPGPPTKWESAKIAVVVTVSTPQQRQRALERLVDDVAT